MARRKQLDEYGKARLNLRLPADLHRFICRHAKATNTTVTQLIIDYFTELKRRDASERVQQI